MTSTPHFALAQHPETGEWTLYRWGIDDWRSLDGNHATVWHPTRVHALYAAAAHARQQLPATDPRYTDRCRERITELDRLIAHERDMQAGDEAAVQTITALKAE